MARVHFVLSSGLNVSWPRRSSTKASNPDGEFSKLPSHCISRANDNEAKGTHPKWSATSPGTRSAGVPQRVSTNPDHLPATSDTSIELCAAVIVAVRNVRTARHHHPALYTPKQPQHHRKRQRKSRREH
jgi:hypothetical protein